MRTFAIGDLQGCLTPLLTLLEKVEFDQTSDQLWFVGDLINRGPESLETLRFVKSLGDCATTVLGNHDLHLLAVLQGFRTPSAKDTLEDILNAPDRDELEHWLRQQPLLHHDSELGFSLVHAGLHTSWTLDSALSLSDQISKRLQSTDYSEFLAQIYRPDSVNWHPQLTGDELLCFAVNCFTRMRYLVDNNTLDFRCTAPPSDAPEGLLPWFEADNRQNQDLKIVFGHWASLGDYRVEGVFPLDSGCVWGNSLTAMELQTGEYYSVAC